MITLFLYQSCSSLNENNYITSFSFRMLLTIELIAGVAILILCAIPFAHSAPLTFARAFYLLGAAAGLGISLLSAGSLCYSLFYKSS